MDLETFAVEARAADAVVVMAVQGGLAQSGVLQAFFEMHGVPVTGSNRDDAPGARNLHYLASEKRVAAGPQGFLHGPCSRSQQGFLPTTVEILAADWSRL